MLTKYLDCYGEDNGQQGGAGAGTLAASLQSMRGSGLKVVKKVDSADD